MAEFTTRLKELRASKDMKQGDLAELVPLREDDREGDAVLAQFGEEVEVNLADVVAAVDEDKEQDELLRVVDVVAHDLLQLLSGFVRQFGIAVAGKVYEIPAVIDQEGRGL